MDKTSVLCFVVGAAIGAVAGWGVSKKLYESRIDKAVQEVKDAYHARTAEQTSDDENRPTVIKYNRKNAAPKSDELGASEDKPNIVEYAQKLHDSGYVDYSALTRNDDTKKEDEEKTDTPSPRIISAEEFEENEDYRKITMYCYNDGVIADEFENEVPDAERLIGNITDSFDEDECLYVRNDELKCDYEILLERRNYSDVMEDRFV